MELTPCQTTGYCTLDKKWSDLETRKLISLYKEYELLWNVSLKDYRNRVKKYKALNEISNKLKVDVSELKRKIHNLRSQYNSEIKKLKNKISGEGTDEVYVSNWPYFAALKFIHVKKTTSSTLTIQEKKTNESMEEIGNEEDTIDNYCTAIVEEEREAEIPTPTIKKKKLEHSQDVPPYIQQAIRQLQTHDEEQIFGDFCASELRQIKNPANKRILKKIVLESITNIGEADAMGVIYKTRSLNMNYSHPNELSSPGSSNFTFSRAE